MSHPDNLPHPNIKASSAPILNVRVHYMYFFIWNSISCDMSYKSITHYDMSCEICMDMFVLVLILTM